MEPADAYEDIGAVTIIGVDSDREDAKKMAFNYVTEMLKEKNDDGKPFYYLVDHDTKDETYPYVYYLDSEIHMKRDEFHYLNELNGMAVVVKMIK